MDGREAIKMLEKSGLRSLCEILFCRVYRAIFQASQPIRAKLIYYQLRLKIEKDPSKAELLVTDLGGYNLVP